MCGLNVYRSWTVRNPMDGLDLTSKPCIWALRSTPYRYLISFGMFLAGLRKIKRGKKEKNGRKKKTPGLHSLHRDEREKPYKCRAKSKGY